MKNKVVIVINGKGGAGKDTLCESICRTRNAKNISSIDPIKEVARHYGWGGEKDDKARRFLSELKAAFVNYNNWPTVYLLDKTQQFLLDDSSEILFVNIREPDQIEEYKKAVSQCPVLTLLVKSTLVNDCHLYGNTSDDNVYYYEYDYIFENAPPLDRSIIKFGDLIDDIWVRTITTSIQQYITRRTTNE